MCSAMRSKGTASRTMASTPLGSKMPPRRPCARVARPASRERPTQSPGELQHLARRRTHDVLEPQARPALREHRAAARGFVGVRREHARVDAAGRGAAKDVDGDVPTDGLRHDLEHVLDDADLVRAARGPAGEHEPHGRRRLRGCHLSNVPRRGRVRRERASRGLHASWPASCSRAASRVRRGSRCRARSQGEETMRAKKSSSKISKSSTSRATQKQGEMHDIEQGVGQTRGRRSTTPRTAARRSTASPERNEAGDVEGGEPDLCPQVERRPHDGCEPRRPREEERAQGPKLAPELIGAPRRLRGKGARLADLLPVEEQPVRADIVDPLCVIGHGARHSHLSFELPTERVEPVSIRGSHEDRYRGSGGEVEALSKCDRAEATHSEVQFGRLPDAGCFARLHGGPRHPGLRALRRTTELFHSRHR